MIQAGWQGLSFENIDLRLCTSCGTCISACPVNALVWRKDDTIGFDRATCIDCGICYAVCPPESPLGIARAAAADDSQIGPYNYLGSAHAADPQIREAGSAGGVVTALLLSALERGLIDGALVVGHDSNRPTHPRAMLARTPEEIRAAAQSKYCLVPVNALLKQAQYRKDRLAVVALPCQAHGIRLAQVLNLSITRQISLVIGIFCGCNLTYEGTAHLLGKLGISADEVTKLEHRGGSWPGGFRARCRDGREAFVPKHHYTYLNLMYAPQGCWYCPDLAAEFADLSVGDYWLGEVQGSSMVIGRTAAGQTLLAGAVEQGHIVTESIPYSKVLTSHQHLLTYKKIGVQVRRRLSRCKPVTGYELPQCTIPDWLGSAAFFGLLRIGSSRLGRWTVGKVPLGLAGRLSAIGRGILRSGNRSDRLV